MASNSQIPKTYSPKDYENLIYSRWQKHLLGSPEQQVKIQNLENPETKTILMPPPNLTGNLHAGHAFQHYFSDTLIRRWRQESKEALWFPGVDHAGIQLEGVIDKLIKKGEFDGVIQNSKFKIQNNTVWDFLQKYDKDEWPKNIKKYNKELWLELAWFKVNLWRNNQQELAKLLGDSPDYSRSLFTMDEQSAKMVELAFKKYWEDGLIYKSEYLINWSVGLQTAVSDIAGETEYTTRIDPFITFEYRLENINFVNPNAQIYEHEINQLLGQVLVGTVRPETIFGDVAVAIHPDVLLQQLKTSHNQKIIFDLIQNKEITLFYSITSLQHSNVQLLLATEVDPNFGTGSLKITPASSLEDYNIWKKYLLEVCPKFPSSIGRDGKLKSEYCGEFSGLTVEQGRLAVIKRLAETGFVPIQKDFLSLETEILKEISESLLAEDFDPKNYSYEEGLKILKERIGDKLEIDWNYEHNVTLCERSKTVIEPLISEEYFISFQNKFIHRPTKVNSKNTKKLKSNIQTKETSLKDLGLLAIQEINWYPDNLADRAKNFLENIQDWTISRDLVWGHKIPVWYNLATNPQKILYGPDTFEVAKKIQISREKPDLEGSWVQEEKILDTWFSSSLWPLATLDLSKYIETRPEFVYIHGGHYFETRQELVEDLKKQEISLEDGVKPKKFKDSLKKLLFQNGINLISPSFPVANFANYSEWKIWFEKYLSKLRKNNLNLIGHSLGAYFLLRYLSENDLKIDNLYLIAGGSKLGDGTESFGSDFQNYSKIQENSKNIFIFHSKDDSIVEFKHGQEVAKNLPKAKFVVHENQNHYLVPKIEELEDSIQSYLDAYNLQNPTDMYQYYPTQTMVTGADIFYIWIVRMAVLGKYFTGSIPFEDVVTHPTVLDEKGRKMSKSLNNGLDVSDQIDRFSSDSVRLALLSGMIPGRNFRMGGVLADKISEKYRNFGNKLWNVGRFLFDGE
jgi:valyl-tRNA synthetase/predicted alpha/beta hydrolase family esterase